MIGRQEILEFARELSLAPHVVEKDYALGWLLAGISANGKIADSWVFKGGTCLKKCFFETYLVDVNYFFRRRQLEVSVPEPGCGVFDFDLSCCC